MHVEPRTRRTNLALVEEDGVGHFGGNGFNVRIRKDDIWGLASELQRDSFQIPGRGAHDGAPDFGGAGEAHLVHTVVSREGGSRLSETGDDVQYARGKTGLQRKLS